MTPSKEAEYTLLATIYACEGLWPEEVSSLLGFNPDRAARLARSSAGRAFCKWILQQPQDFLDGFRLAADQSRKLAPDVQPAGCYCKPGPEKDLIERMTAVDQDGKPPPD